jgi:hypothetical protein
VPILDHFKGKGLKVAASMRKKYGKRWKNVFYAVENKRKKGRSDVVAAGRMN